MEPVATDVRNAAEEESGNGAVGEVHKAYERQRDAARMHPYPPYRERAGHLKRLLAAVRSEQHALARAIAADFGHRSSHETMIAEVMPVVAGIKHALSHLKSWMKPRSRPVALTFQPGRAEVRPQPLGVVGIIAPWNYPFQLAIAPLVGALAAGNRVLLKPSELTPSTGELLKGMIAEHFDPSQVSVLTGGVEVGEAVCSLPLDHLLFTGSTRVGKTVMRLAAERLTPVTLELGGKSPTLLHPDYPLDKAVERVVAAKLFNAGQTCVAPDYLLIHRAQVDALVSALRDRVRACYPTLKGNPDYSAIINPGHYARLRALISDAATQGATVIELNPADETLEDAERKLAPTLLLDVRDEMDVMQEEIFGPLLPVITYEAFDEALVYINDRPRPLALYYFDSDRKRVRRVLDSTLSGGVCVNDAALHFFQEELPFGGVGASGMGAYHGSYGFEAFSHTRGVFYQSKINVTSLTNPPFGPSVERLMGVLIGK